MIKALLKKQLMEANTWLIQDKKNGRRRSKAAMAGWLLLYGTLFVILGSVFFQVANEMCKAMLPMELDWLYFSMMALMAMLLGIFGSVFNTYATLYQAKDNELLLAMPIPPLAILLTRTLGVWMWSLIYEAIVFVPALLAYWIQTGAGIGCMLCGILVLWILSVFVLALACILGWVVAKVSAKLKNKSLITVLLSVLFLGAYYYVYFKANELLQTILLHAVLIGEKIRGSVPPLYWMGNGAVGDEGSLFLFFLCVALIMTAVLWVMNRSFMKMATLGNPTAKKVYKRKGFKVRSRNSALFRKEFRRFTSNATYMLNCSLGSLFMVVAGIVMVVKGQAVRELLEVLTLMGLPSDTILLIGCAGLCMMASMNDITAPSISLEGKNLWILRSLPIPTWEIFRAKLKLHVKVSGIPAIFLAICMTVALQENVKMGLLWGITVLLFVILTALIGLVVNLFMPNLHWTNETVPIKESMGVMISLMGSWALVIFIAFLYYILRHVLSEMLFLILTLLTMAGMILFMVQWLKTKGTAIFERL